MPAPTARHRPKVSLQPKRNKNWAGSTSLTTVVSRLRLVISVCLRDMVSLPDIPPLGFCGILEHEGACHSGPSSVFTPALGGQRVRCNQWLLENEAPGGLETHFQGSSLMGTNGISEDSGSPCPPHSPPLGAREARRR